MSLKDMASRADSWLNAAEALGERKAEAKFDGDTRLGRAAQTGTVLTVVTLAITAIIGILVYAEVQSALPSPQNQELNNASTNVTEGFGQSMELVPAILVVLLAAVVLAVVQRFR